MEWGSQIAQALHALDTPLRSQPSNWGQRNMKRSLFYDWAVIRVA